MEGGVFFGEKGQRFKRYPVQFKEKEVVWPEGEMTLEELIRRTKGFEIFYNEEYPHSALGYKSPKEYYNEVMVYQKCV